MPEPFSTAAGAGASGIVSAKLLSVLVGFSGAVATLSYMGELKLRHWLSALMLTAIGSYYLPPFVLAWAKQAEFAARLPPDAIVEGATCAVLGLTSIFIMGGLAVIGRRFSRDPVGFVSRRGGEEEKS